MISNPRRAAEIGLVLLSLTLAGCGGGDEPGTTGPGGRGRRRRSSSTARAPSSGSARPPRRRSPRSTPTSRSSSTTTGPAAASAATSRARSTSSTPRGRPRPTRRRRPRRRASSGPGSWSATTGSRVVVNPKNDFVKSLTVEQLKTIWEPEQQGQDLEGRRPVLARPQDHPLLARQRLGDLRVLHRGDRRQGQEPARGRAAELRRQHPGQRRRRRRRRPRLFRLRLLRRQQGQAPGGRRSRTGPTPSRSLPSPATIARQDLHPAVAAAVSST